MEYAERILGLSSEMDKRLKEISGGIGGALLVGASTTVADFMLPCILGAFKTAHPQVQPQLGIANSETIEARVAENDLDLGFIESPPHLRNLEVETCCEDELVVVCAPQFPLAAYKELTPAQLAPHPYASREAGSGTREFTDDYFAQNGISPRDLQLAVEMGSSVALAGYVSSGSAYAIMSRVTVASCTAKGELVAIPLKPRFKRTISVVLPARKISFAADSGFC